MLINVLLIELHIMNRALVAGWTLEGCPGGRLCEYKAGDKFKRVLITSISVLHLDNVRYDFSHCQ